MEESFYLQASLDSFDSATPEIKTLAEAAMSPYSGKSMTPSAMEHIESTLRQKDGELSSYMSRLVRFFFLLWKITNNRHTFGSITNRC